MPVRAHELRVRCRSRLAFTWSVAANAVQAPTTTTRAARRAAGRRRWRREVPLGATPAGRSGSGAGCAPATATRMPAAACSRLVGSWPTTPVASRCRNARTTSGGTPCLSQRGDGARGLDAERRATARPSRRVAQALHTGPTIAPPAGGLAGMGSLWRTTAGAASPSRRSAAAVIARMSASGWCSKPRVAVDAGRVRARASASGADTRGMSCRRAASVQRRRASASSPRPGHRVRPPGDGRTVASWPRRRSTVSATGLQRSARPLGSSPVRTWSPPSWAR